MELHFFLEQLDGQRRELVHPVSFSLVRSADTPADSLKAEFMVPDAQDWEQEIARVELQADGRRLFRGICDRQIVGLDSAGCRLTVWARSDAAVLQGSFALDKNLGSRLHTLPNAPKERQEELALEYAQEALLDLPAVRVVSAKRQGGEELELTFELAYSGEEGEQRFVTLWALNF